MSNGSGSKSSKLIRSFSLRKVDIYPSTSTSTTTTTSSPSSSRSNSFTTKRSSQLWKRWTVSSTKPGPRKSPAKAPEFLPLIRVVSPFTFDPTSCHSSPPKRRPMFTLESRSDTDLQQEETTTTTTTRARTPTTITTSTYTVAMAMTDEQITDEVLVQELEKLRVVRQDIDVSDLFWEHPPPLCDSPKPLDPLSSLPSLPSFLTQSPNDDSWHTTRSSLLTCRECIRTERHYLASIKALLASETLSLPPPLMLRYAAELVNVSHALLARMEENPSALGVATAFLAQEEAVENAFVAWCGVVGEWFAAAAPDEGPPVVRSRLTKHRDSDPQPPPTSSLKRTMSGWRRRSMDPLPASSSSSSASSASSSASSASSSATSSAPTPVTSQSLSFAGSFLHRRRDKLPSNASITQESTPGHQRAEPTTRPTRRPAVRDLAILPTQRVMRYVLLFRDLLAHTPLTSPSRALVERAVDAAVRIASKCDRAQDNAAFIATTRAAEDTLSPLEFGGRLTVREEEGEEERSSVKRRTQSFTTMPMHRTGSATLKKKTRAGHDRQQHQEQQNALLRPPTAFFVKGTHAPRERQSCISVV